MFAEFQSGQKRGKYTKGEPRVRPQGGGVAEPLSLPLKGLLLLQVGTKKKSSAPTTSGGNTGGRSKNITKGVKEL